MCWSDQSETLYLESRLRYGWKITQSCLKTMLSTNQHHSHIYETSDCRFTMHPIYLHVIVMWSVWNYFHPVILRGVRLLGFWTNKTNSKWKAFDFSFQHTRQFDTKMAIKDLSRGSLMWLNETPNAYLCDLISYVNLYVKCFATV